MNALNNLDEIYRGNIQQPLLMIWLHSGGQRSKVKVIAGRRGGEDIHVDAGALKSTDSSTYDH